MFALLLLVACANAGKVYCDHIKIGPIDINGGNMILQFKTDKCLQISDDYSFEMKKGEDEELTNAIYNTTDCSGEPFLEGKVDLKETGCTFEEPYEGVVATVKHTFDSKCEKKSGIELVFTPKCDISKTFRLNVIEKDDKESFGVSKFVPSKCDPQSNDVVANTTVIQCDQCFNGKIDVLGLISVNTGISGELKCGAASTFVLAFLAILAFFF